MLRTFLVFFFSLFLLVQCSSTSSTTNTLQSSCVHDYISLDRTTDDGDSCYNFSYSDCGADPMGSECINYCAFDVCQSTSCESDADCASLGSGYECESFIVSGTDYGMWCHYTYTGGGYVNSCDGCGGVFCGGDCIGCPQC